MSRVGVITLLAYDLKRPNLKLATILIKKLYFHNYAINYTNRQWEWYINSDIYTIQQYRDRIICETHKKLDVFINFTVFIDPKEITVWVRRPRENPMRYTVSQDYVDPYGLYAILQPLYIQFQQLIKNSSIYNHIKQIRDLVINHIIIHRLY
jgi:hypothetical protein